MPGKRIESSGVRMAAAIALAGLAAYAPRAAWAQASVTIAGNLQSELGCVGDWAPECTATAMQPGTDGVWRFAAGLPAGDHAYKAAVDQSWSEHYGLGGALGGASVPLPLATVANVRFYFRRTAPGVAVLTDNRSQRIVGVPGSFQSELGCPGDWMPECLRVWAVDPDFDGLYVAQAQIPAGSYEFKFAIDESWTENYGIAGVPNGDNFFLGVAPGCTQIRFTFASATNIGGAECVSFVFGDGFE